MEWSKIFANHILDKGLISKYIGNSYNSIANNNHNHNLIKKWAKDLNRHFSTEDIPMAKMYRKNAQLH